MVAVLQPTARPRRSAPGAGPTTGQTFAPGPRFAEPGARSRPAHLRLVEAQRRDELIDPRLLAGAAIGTLMLLVVVLRIIQGGPPADTWAGLEAQADQASATIATSSMVSSPADIVIVAEAGDSWWAIAQEFAPGADTAEVVQLLTARNGGSALAVGQQVIIPASLPG